MLVSLVILIELLFYNEYNTISHVQTQTILSCPTRNCRIPCVVRVGQFNFPSEGITQEQDLLSSPKKEIKGHH